MTWRVEVAEYMGEGHWADNPPLDFPDKEQADSFAELVNANQQVGGQTKVRRVFEVNE